MGYDELEYYKKEKLFGRWQIAHSTAKARNRLRQKLLHPLVLITKARNFSHNGRVDIRASSSKKDKEMWAGSFGCRENFSEVSLAKCG